MKTTHLAMLAGAALIVGGLAYWSQQRAAPVLSETATLGPLSPGLSERLNDVAEIALRKGKDTTTLRKAGNDWTIVEKSGYPAMFESVKQLAINLAALEKLQAKSDKPEHYKVLGVADPAPDNDVAAGVELKDSTGKAIRSLVIGGTRGGFGGAPAEATVRIPGEAQVWQVRGTAVINADPLFWLQRTILEVNRERVKQVVITPSVAVDAGAVGPSTSLGSRLVLTRETPETTTFAVADLPAGRELSSASAGDGIGAALAYVSFDDVKAASVLKDVPPLATAEYRTFDGLVVKSTVYKQDTSWYATFSAVFEEPAAPPATAGDKPGADGQPEAKPAAGKSRDEVNKEVAKINSTLGGWAFLLPEFKAKQLSSAMSDLLKPLETPKAPTAAGPSLPEAPAPLLPPAPQPTGTPPAVPTPAPEPAAPK
ncbi:MAG: DUF4340 domain-containing protein [Planctomycetota bacterium]|nr:DUF4340 domain-containing protein [Planctomycetota bacterium]